jgi:hypothetical protein
MHTVREHFLEVKAYYRKERTTSAGNHCEVIDSRDGILRKAPFYGVRNGS